MPLTAIELEKLKTSFGDRIRGVMENRAEIQRKIDYIIKRTQDADLPYEEAINLSWKQICLFSQENVWYLIQHNRVTISQVKDWTGLHISTVAHPLITERLDHPDILQWIDIISYKLTAIFQNPKITTLVQRHIIPWEALLELAYFDEIFCLLSDDEVLNFLLQNAFTFEELKAEKASVVMLAKEWVTREELAGYTECQRNLLISSDVNMILSHKKNHGRITAQDLLSFNEIQLSFVCHVYSTILNDTRHTADTLRNIPLTVCIDILGKYQFARELKLGTYETEDVARILNSYHQTPEPSDELLCSISMTPMSDPVCDPQFPQFPFEREQICRWLSIRQIHPFTRLNLTVSMLEPWHPQSTYSLK